jgi:hypothetical protein
MQKSKFVDIFYSLAPHEKIAFQKWVNSPFFNKNIVITELLNVFYNIDLEKGRHLLDRKSIHKTIFPNIPFNITKLRHLVSELTKLLERFLVFQYQKANNIQFQLDLSKVYKQKGLINLCKQSVYKAEKLHQQSSLEEIKHLEVAHLIESAKYHNTLEKDRSTSNNLQELNNTFDLSYIAGKLKHSCRILSHQGMYITTYDMGLLNQVLIYLEEHPNYLDIPAIGLYYYYYMTSVNTQKETLFFKKFKNCLLKYQHLFKREEIRDLYILATNYSIKRLNTNQRDYYLQETFELYEQALNSSILLENKKISPFAFTNIVAVSLGLQKYTWTWDFLQTYSSYLPQNIRQAYTDYNFSRWYFHQKQYQKAEELLVADNFEDLHLNLSVKMLLLKIYYELGEFQLLDALLNRFNTYLSRKKALVYHKKNYNNIIRFTKRLVTINSFSQKAKEKLQKDIQAVDLLTEKVWLLQQLESL